MKLLSQIKKDIEFNHGLYNIVEILKQISLSQYHIFEKKIKPFEKFFIAVENFFAAVNIDPANFAHPLINTANRPCGVIAVTSDSGLLGGLNMQIINLALKEVAENRANLIIIGEKGKNYASETNTPFVAFEGIKDDTKIQQALALRDYIIKEELGGKLGVLKIIYPRSLSIIAQEIKTLQLVPFSKSAYMENSELDKPAPLELILESSVEDIVEYLFYLLLGYKLNEIFGLSRLAELSARFVHLEESKTKVEQLNKQLRLQYFRQRHELIDRSMRELFAARLAFK